MKIALIGYGKMGKLIEEIALQNEHKIVAIIDPQFPGFEITKENLHNADVCIDFSAPQHILENIKTLASLNQTIVVGTTGWYDHLDLVKELVAKYKIGFLYAPNFSIGVNIFLKIVTKAASLINHFDEYDVGGYEIHHNQKQDSPSGTAKSIAHSLLDSIDRKDSLVYDQINRKIEPNELHFASLRAGSNPGQHTVIFDSPSDTITMTHQARNREGFARGAILASEWLMGKKGFYTINDFLGATFHA